MSCTSPNSMRIACQEFLGLLPQATLRKGERYFKQGAVRSLKFVTPNAVVEACVTGSALQPYTVRLSYDKQRGDAAGALDAECSCPLQLDCKHVVAALHALMKHLGSKTAPGDAAKVIPFPGRNDRTDGKNPATARAAFSLESHLATALGRGLDASESAYIRQIESTFAECKSRKAFMGWNANALGFRVPGQSWDRLEIWPRLPRDILEFWNHVAYAAIHSWGGTLRPFLAPISNFQTDDPELRAWCRRESIDCWS